jgi:hypothetical protein
MTSIKLRSLVNEIIDLAQKSPILADKKLILFCEQYTQMKLNKENPRSFLEFLCKEQGLNSDSLFNNVS